MSITLEQYSEKAIVLFGETEKEKNNIKALGGKYNSNLKGRPGWVFTNSSRPKLEAFLNSLEDGTTEPVPIPSVKTTQSAIKSEPDVLADLIRRITELEAKVEKLQPKQPAFVDNTSECDEPEPEKPKRLLKRK
jgi:hypothetical protein